MSLATVKHDTQKEFYSKMAAGLRGRNISLIDFAEEAWHIIEPGRKFQRHWMLEYIAEYLELVTKGKIQRIGFNCPPRSGKSNFVSVIWPAWEWTQDPTRRSIFASYSQGLGVKHSIHRRAIIESDWFQGHWGGFVKMAIDQNQKAEYENTQRGRHDTTSPGGTVTGKGGDVIVLDDLINPDEADSKAARTQAFSFIDRTLSTRLDDKKRGAIVCIEQRLGVKDVTAHLELKKGVPYTFHVFPAIAEKRMVYIFPKSKRVIIREEGDALWPERETAKDIEAQKLDMGSVRWQAQYQQKPEQVDGSIIKREWWKFYREAPKKFKRLIWSWDTAHKDKEHNDPTAGLLIGETKNGFYILGRVKRRMEFPELKKEVRMRYEANKTQYVLIEDKASGQDLVPELKSNTTMPVKAVKVDKDKVARVNYVIGGVEAGNWYLPDDASWVADFIDECSAFPNGDHDDQIDAWSQGATFLKGKRSSARITVHTWDDGYED